MKGKPVDEKGGSYRVFIRSLCFLVKRKLCDIAHNRQGGSKIPPITKQKAMAGTVPAVIPVAISDKPAKRVKG